MVRESDSDGHFGLVEAARLQKLRENEKSLKKVFDLDSNISRGQLMRYDPNLDYIKNFNSAMTNVSFLVDFSKFFRSKLVLVGTFSKSIDVDKTFNDNFIRSFDAYSKVLPLIIEILGRVLGENETQFKNAGISDIVLFKNNFKEIISLVSMCKSLHKDYTYSVLNSSRSSVSSPKKILKQYKKTFFELCASLDNLVPLYNEMNLVLEKIRV
jgi:hypothetical protein